MAISRTPFLLPALDFPELCSNTLLCEQDLQMNCRRTLEEMQPDVFFLHVLRQQTPLSFQHSPISLVSVIVLLRILQPLPAWRLCGVSLIRYCKL